MDGWIDSIRTLVAIAITLLLVLLRAEAETFEAAEYDEPTREGGFASFSRRLSWFALGIGLIGALLLAHPNAAGDLRIGLGDRLGAILLGFGLGLVGTLQAVGYAYYRYGLIRLPPGWTYPGAVLNAVGTAFVDEVTFRGAVLGFLVLAGVPPALAVVAQALVYTLATRTGAPGRGRYMFVLTLVGGLVAGWATVASGAIGAAFLAHVVTRIAVFVATGHAGQPAPRGKEIEETWEYRRPPRGWRRIDGPDDRGPAAR